MASEKDNQWIFTKEQLAKSPSRKHVDPEKELGYRQQAANLIQDMGQRLSVNQLTINTAIVYMHRFYMYHSFTVFSRYAIAPTALFLAAKVEEQPKKLEHVLKICYTCLHPDKPHLDTHSDNYLKQAQELVQNELVLLQTLGFDISVDHPHTHVVKCAQLVKASRDLSQMAYFMATNSLHLTRFCLLYKPTVVAAMCIHLSCKWSNYEIPLSSDGKPYWSYMDPCITEPLLDTIVKEFLQILNRCPTRLRKLKNYRPSNDKEESKDKDTKVQQPPATQTVTSQSSSTVPTSSNSKEKKPMSLEEYKRTHTKQQAPQKVSHPTSALHPNHHKQTHPPNQGPPKHPDNRSHPQHGSLHQRDPNKPQQHPLPHPDPHHSHRSAPKHGQRPTDQSVRPNPPPPHPNAHAQQRQAYEMQKQAKEAQRNMMTAGQHKTKPPNANPAKSNDVAEIDAVSKDLEGRIRSEKTHLPSAEQHSHHRSATHPSSGQNVAPSSKSASQEAPRRHHSDKGHEAPHSHQRPVKEFKQYSRKALYEMYQKNPEKLRVYLKHKAQSTPLSEDERPIYKKLQAIEEEHRKRKAIEKQQKSKIENLPTPAASPGGGNLTLRIKLPGNSSGEPNPNTSVAKIIGSSSGSGSEASPVRSRKRGHGTEQVEHNAAKHSRRSEDHHKHHRSSGNGSSSGGNHKHKRHHKHHSRSKNEHIDEAVFQKSLSAAISKVQQQQIPTVTLKKAANGGDGATYFASSHTKADLDAAAPVSSTMPDDIFEDDIDSGTGGTSSQVATLESTHSTPEPGEIKDDTPPPIHPQQQQQRWNAGKKFESTTQGLFSPQSDSGDQKMQRSSSGFGYHSNNENEFASPPPPLMRKPVQ